MAGRGLPGRAPGWRSVSGLRLITRGVGNAEACRIAGVHPKTGKRWRLGRTITGSGGRRRHYPPVISARKAEVSPRFLSEDERVRIADLHQAGLGVRAIAGQLGRSPSTVSRELRRNGQPGSGCYRPFAAQRLAARRRARPGRGKLNADPVLRQFVAGRLGKRWSPEQISRALRARDLPGDPSRHLVHETIYQAIYRPQLGGLRREVPGPLRTGRRRRKPHRRCDARRAGALTGMTMLSQRPAAATSSEAGHWEGIWFAGALNRSAIAALVNRASRFTILVHLPGQRHTCESATLSCRPWRCPGAATQVDHLGPRQRDGPARPVQDRDRHRDLLLRPALTLAAGHQREHLLVQDGRAGSAFDGSRSGAGRRVTRRTRAERLSVDMSTAARWARALTGSDLIEAC